MELSACQTFNRTSLELKQYDESLYGEHHRPFNRTSLELKPDEGGRNDAESDDLLIAPVWN